MKKSNVLVFPCGSEIGLELFRSLSFAKEVQLFGGSSVPDHGQYVYENYIKIPFISSPDFESVVNNVIKEHHIDYVFPAHDSAIVKFAEMSHEKKLACTVITSPFETCRIARSKKLTMEALKEVVSVPKLYNKISEVSSFPVFLKPDVGQGSKGTALANNREEAEFYLKKSDNLLILEYLPGEEYTIDCYTNNNGELIFSGARQRCRISNGISVNTKPIINPEIETIAQKINEKLELRGMWFFQLKKSSTGVLTLLEVAPRLAGTMGMYRNLGVNFALMNIYEKNGYNVSAMPNTHEIEMDRALFSRFKTNLLFEHVYIDFDDCLLINGKVNITAIAFLYQCLNAEIKIHLITRHAEDIHEKLSKHRITNLFSSVIHLKNGEKKSSYIKNKPSIFIDDSFAERLDVKKTLQISVFAPDAIESLLK